MAPPALRHHTTGYVDRVVRLTRPLAGRRPAAHAATQARLAATNAAASYRAACLARTAVQRTAAFRAAVDALEESIFWLQLLRLMEATSAPATNAAIDAGTTLLALMGHVEATHGSP